MNEARGMRLMRRALGLSLMVLLSALAPGLQGAEPAAAPLRAKLGAYYFDGWSGQTKHITDRLQTEFAAREPVWGWRDDSPPVMRQQIDFAADHGLAFFAFDWYWPEGPIKETDLNNALGLYLKAPNRDRLQFCLLVANHAGFRIGPDDWNAVCRRWLDLFKNPAYLRLDGKPLLIIFSPGELLKAFGGPKAVREAFNTLRRKAKAEGISDVAIAACVAQSKFFKDLADAGFTLFTGYNYPTAGRSPSEKRQPFAGMVEFHQKTWNMFAAESPLPYIPVVTAGWDKRPWEPADQPPQGVFFPDRTPEQVGQFVGRAVTWLDQHPDKTPRERLILIYAWNENGEGGYLTPTKTDGAAYLEAIKKALSGKAP